MAIGVMQDVWTRSAAKPIERLVLLALADSANADTRDCWPSVAHIATRCNLSIRRVQYALRALVATGELSVDPGGGRTHTARYRVGLNGADVCTVSPVEADEKGCTDRPKGCTDLPERVQTSAPGTVRNRKKDLQARTQGRRFPEPFPDEYSAQAIALGLSAAEVEPLFVEFGDYWRGVPGSRGLKVDWLATWRNRVRYILAHRRPTPNGAAAVVAPKRPATYPPDVAAQRRRFGL